ncbi:ankyrin repeat and LEM domain-containing protein 2 homolog [Palaemon carinicauda]|uniref:ankyrin repeat and LEM domain-containing protein 2 homolog n=1 Tax=Palaemon carinicauda TaxID=392227 RepID=UPI0035B6594D
MKKFRGSRFKSFSTYEDALYFAENGPVIALTQNIGVSEDNKTVNLNAEKPSPYRGPKSQDLVKFRKAIEKDDMVYFDKCIEENPRYLVSSGDTPSILQEGSRYNALHIACRTDRPKFITKVLSTVADPQFFQRLYPDDTLESSARRSMYLLDAYLNTPDKGLNETPLHFASKHGSLECVRILTSYPDCSKTRKNKFSQTPLESVGSRAKNLSKAAIQEICNLLGDHYYVPLLRNDDLCVLPQVGEPWSPKQDSPGFLTEEQQLLACISPSSSGSPLSPATPTLKVRGYAGPMSPSQAESFYRRWRETGCLSPSRSTKARVASLRLTDRDKGLERVGRDLALTNGYNWNEYWSFLGSFTNLASEDGLAKLEKHLRLKFMQLMVEQHELDASDLREKLCNISEVESCDRNTLHQNDEGNDNNRNLGDSNLSRASLSTMGELCQELEALRLNASLSPQLDSSGQPVISASSKFLQSWKEQEKLQGSGEDAVDRSGFENQDVQYVSYITKSIHVSASRLADVLGDLAKELQCSTITNLSLGRTVRTKLKPEILCLKNVVSKCFAKDLKTNVDCGFIHILLAFKATEFVQQNLMPVDLCILAETLKVVVSNLNFMNVNSSDEEDNYIEPRGKKVKINNTNHISCVLHALEKALTIAYNNCSSDLSENVDSNSLRMHLLQLGDCTCSWSCKDEKAPVNETPVSNRNYGKAFNFHHDTLFSDSKKEVIQKEISCRKYSETIVKHLTFEEHGEKVIKATLTVGSGVLNKIGTIHEKLDKEQEKDDNESFVSAVSSVEDDMVTPDEGAKVYINGPEPSKIDADVLTAIESRDVDENVYPHVSQWLHLMNSFSEEQRNSWVSPSQVSFSVRPSSVKRISGTDITTPSSSQRTSISLSTSRILFHEERDFLSSSSPS